MVSVIPSNYIKIRFAANFHNEDRSAGAKAAQSARLVANPHRRGNNNCKKIVRIICELNFTLTVIQIYLFTICMERNLLLRFI